MKCRKCRERAVFDEPNYCKEHFIGYFEAKVKKAIKGHGMIGKGERVCVAVSGGKDSTVLLYLLKKFGYDIEALALDEGIEGYRDITLKFLKKFCNNNNIRLRIYSYEKEIGNRLDKIIPKGQHACTVCGTFRRSLLNKHAEGYGKIATGHNMDDEAQAVLMNLFKTQADLFFRQGPKTAKIEGFTQKIKPLYFMSEKEVRAYAFLMHIDVPFVECPYTHESLRSEVREALNDYESRHPGSKRNIISHFLKVRGPMPKDMAVGKCSVCGSPCSSVICKACRLKQEIMA